MGESSGVPAVELATVEGIDSAVVVRLMAAFCDKAVVLIVSTSWCVWDRWYSSVARRAEGEFAAHSEVRGGPNVAVERGGVYQWLRELNQSNALLGTNGWWWLLGGEGGEQTEDDTVQLEEVGTSDEQRSGVFCAFARLRRRLNLLEGRELKNSRSRVSSMALALAPRPAVSLSHSPPSSPILQRQVNISYAPYSVTSTACTPSLSWRKPPSKLPSASSSSCRRPFRDRPLGHAPRVPNIAYPQCEEGPRVTSRSSGPPSTSVGRQSAWTMGSPRHAAAQHAPSRSACEVPTRSR